MKKLITPTVVLSLSSLFAYCLSGQSREVYSVPIIYFLTAYSLLVQVIASIPAIIYSTEKYYDLTGSITFISITFIASLTNEQINLKQTVAGLMVLIWAGRLGSFLFLRINKTSIDSRFIEIKKTKIRFFYAWLIQGLWVIITMGPLLAVMTTKSFASTTFNLLEFIGIGIWITGLAVEIISDEQKTSFNDNPDNKDRFINIGLWKYSRHPNYVGEITLWTGATIFAASSLSGGQYVTLIGPIFVYLLISKVSGVPLLEKKADLKWGQE